MHHVCRFLFLRPLYGLIALTLLTLVACGDKEPAQRAAFIDILEKKVLAQKYHTLPQLSSEEQKAVGNYSTHYAIIWQYQTNLNEKVSQNPNVFKDIGKMTSLQSMMGKRDEVAQLAKDLYTVRILIEEQLSVAEKAKKDLQQPADLEKIYNAAYIKLVSAPAAATIDTLIVLEKLPTVALALFAYIDTHKNDIEIQGRNVIVKNEALEEEVQRFLQTGQDSLEAARQSFSALSSIME